MGAIYLRVSKFQLRSRNFRVYCNIKEASEKDIRKLPGFGRVGDTGAHQKRKCSGRRGAGERKRRENARETKGTETVGNPKKLGLATRRLMGTSLGRIHANIDNRDSRKHRRLRENL